MRERTAPVTEQDANEYELVLGNKQLLGILFLVVVLFGVFFAMGYVMGRNSAPMDSGADRSGTDGESVRPSQVRQSIAEETNEPVEIGTEGTQAAAEGGRAETIEVVPGSGKAQASVSALPLVGEPQAGHRYLQVSAVAKPEAELLVEILTRKNFKALIAPGPNDRLFRVLVGPVNDQEDSVRVRSDLEAAGFKPIPRQY